jgi:hypothetical protein
MRHFSADAGGFTTTMEVRAMTAGINTKPPIGLLRHVRKPRDHEDVPIGSKVRTPRGLLAVVEDYIGYGERQGEDRPHRVRLVCRYLNPSNKRFATVQILPELVEIVELGMGRLS